MLVEYAQAGQEAAFTFLVEYHQDAVCRFLAHRVSDYELGRELTQVVFLKAWQNLHKTDAEIKHKFKPWLYRIAERLAVDYLREPRVLQQSLEELEEGITTGCPSMLRSLSMEEPEDITLARERITYALKQISPVFWQCIYWQDFKGYTQREIAGRLGISESCVSAYVSRGHQQFRKAYDSWQAK